MSIGEWIALIFMAALLVCVVVVWLDERKDEELNP